MERFSHDHMEIVHLPPNSFIRGGFGRIFKCTALLSGAGRRQERQKNKNKVVKSIKIHIDQLNGKNKQIFGM